MTEILAGNRLAEHFREKVQRAFINQNIEASEMCEYYLVNLLQEFYNADRLFAREGEQSVEQPLALMLFEAMKGDLATKTRCLKRLGDTALYLSGFFAENMKKRLVGLDYYLSMGGSAYGSLATMFTAEQTFSSLYGELSGKFRNFVSVLTEVSPWEHIHNDTDLLKVYERWLTSGDKRLEQVLRAQGICLEIAPHSGKAS